MYSRISGLVLGVNIRCEIPLTLPFKLLIKVFVDVSFLLTILCKLSLSVSFLSILVFNELKTVFSVKSSCTCFVKSAKSIGTVFNFGISNLSTFVFNKAKFVFNAKLLV